MISLISFFDALTSLILLPRFKSDDERIPVTQIVDGTFPHLLNIFGKLVQINNPVLEIAGLIKLICKIFWSSIYVRACITRNNCYI